MSFIDAITPKDTEEIKPGLFIQNRGDGKYRQIHPMAWNGKLIWKNAIFGGGSFRSFLYFVILLFLVWSYNHDVQEYKEFYLSVHENPAPFCSAIIIGRTNNDGSSIAPNITNLIINNTLKKDG